MEILQKGAEANLYIQDGILIKERVKKVYRHPALDERLRKKRTKAEAKNLQRAFDSGINTPKLISCDEKNYTLKMQYLEGEQVKDVFERGEGIGVISQKIGKMLQKLHNIGLVHNDLTTSNLLAVGGDIYMIDFGLAYFTKRVEDLAMDLVVFKKSIYATHTKQFDTIWSNLLIGYGGDRVIISRVEKIEKRVRYK